MKKALVIGINNYPTAPLTACINDANAFKAIIESNGDGSPNFDTRMHLDVQTKGELKGLIKDLFSGNSDTALLYFSGHGALDETGGYIATPDYEQNDVGLAMDEILKIVNQSKCINKVVILDCCHSGAFGAAQPNSGFSGALNDGISVLTASGTNQAAEAMINGHGIFTNLLLEALKGGAADLRGKISPGGIYAYIDQALGEWGQRPFFKTNISRFTPLREVNPQVSTEIIRKLTKYFKTAQDMLPLDPSFEDTNTNDVDHKVIEPYANEINVATFKDLQKLQSVGLVIPDGEQHMYYAAMNSKGCRLTALGHHYWRLVNEKRL